MTNIYDLANELERGIRALPEYKPAEEQAAVQELAQKVEANALLKEYLAAQQGLSVYLNDIERIIFKPLQELNS